MRNHPVSLNLTSAQCRAFHRDGFLAVESILDQTWVACLHKSFDRLFSGNFETGTQPDEVNWQFADGDPKLTRQICNGWKADRMLATIVLDQQIGAAIARLGAWPGSRLIQDNVLWKPPGAGTVGFHRDNAYLAWYTPQEMLSCWIALDDTCENGGTLELARGSHLWHKPANDESDGFHNPDDYLAALHRAAARNSAELDLVKVQIPGGGCVFHHGWTWHGSGVNRSENERRALVVHAASSEARFQRGAFASGNGPIYSRYRALGNDQMSEDHFPILWCNDGYRTADIETFLSGAAHAESE